MHACTVFDPPSCSELERRRETAREREGESERDRERERGRAREREREGEGEGETDKARTNRQREREKRTERDRDMQMEKYKRMYSMRTFPRSARSPDASIQSFICAVGASEDGWAGAFDLKYTLYHRLYIIT